MGFDVQYLPDYSVLGPLFRAAGSAVAERDNLDRSIERRQEADQFAANLQQNYAQMAQASRERAIDRNYDWAGQQLRAQFSWEQQANQHQQALDQIDAEYALRNKEYTQQQQAKREQLRNQMDYVKEQAANGSLTEEQASSVMLQLQTGYKAIAPTREKPQPMSEYPTVRGLDGVDYHVVPGRNGAPQYLPPPGTLSPMEREELKLKQEAADLARRTARAELRVKLEGARRIVGGDEVPAFSPKEIEAKLDRDFGTNPAGSGGDQSPNIAPIHVHSSVLESAAASAPPGTVFVTETGEVFQN